jgi:hypothetical protein
MKYIFLLSITLLLNISVEGQEKFLKLTDILVLDSSKTSSACCADLSFYRLTVPAGKFYKITYLQTTVSGASIQSSSYLKINTARIYQISEEATNPNSNNFFSRKSELWLKGGDIMEWVANPIGSNLGTYTLYLSAQVYELSQ